MNHWIIAPVVLPAIMAPLIIIFMRHHLGLQRIFSTIATALMLAISLGLLARAAGGSIDVYELGNWPAPFGIVLVLDRLSALMITLTSVLGLISLFYAMGTGWDGRGKHFHALFQFQMMGILGAFLTGDAFNLFVFFEVLLIASYGLMIHGGGARRLRAGIQYVVYNLLGSTLFLFALGTIYSVTGTLNMADLAERVAALPPDDTALIHVGAVLLLMVFAVKAAVLPLHFWLPGSYANAPGPVAALFAIMTKVGAYSILRIYTLVFGADIAVTNGVFDTWLMPAALLTLVVGMVGVLGSRQIARLAAFGAIGSMGTLLIAIAMFTPAATTAALYYMVHSTFAAAALFLIADMVAERRGDELGRINTAPPMAQNGLIAALFFVTAIAITGMPPLSGFIGKLLVMDAARSEAQAPLIWGTILVMSLVGIIGMARAGSLIFWKTTPIEDPPEEDDEPEVQPTQPPQPVLPVIAIFAMLTPLVLITVFAGPTTDYLSATAQQLFAPEAYINAVLNRQ